MLTMKHKNWFRALFMWPGVDVVLGDRRATILARLPYWYVHVRLFEDDQAEEAWWRGNLKLVV